MDKSKFILKAKKNKSEDISIDLQSEEKVNDLENYWKEELRRRYQAVLAGEMEMIPYENVLKK